MSMDRKKTRPDRCLTVRQRLKVRGNTRVCQPWRSKLEKAMKNFGVELEGKVCMDVGASTGGFTDCMLQNGAVKVYSVDVGHGQLDWKLRNDERVVCWEKDQHPLCDTGRYRRAG